MRKAPLFVGSIVLVAILLLVVYGIAVLAPLDYSNENTPEDLTLLSPLERPNVDFGNPVLGAMDAPVTIVEFGDFQCPACAELDLSLKLILEEYTGQVRIVWKDLPNIGLHSESLNAALAARCAGDQGAFWEYHDLLFDRQGSVLSANMLPFAAELSYNLDDFQECLDEQRASALIQRDREEALRLRVDATPYLFINDRRVTGAVSVEQLRGFIDAELAKIDQNKVETPEDVPETTP